VSVCDLTRKSQINRSVISTDNNASDENNNNILLPAVRLLTYASVLVFFHTRTTRWYIIYIYIFKSTIGNERTNDYSDHVRGAFCVSTVQRKHPRKISESSRNSDNNNSSCCRYRRLNSDDGWAKKSPKRAST